MQLQTIKLRKLLKLGIHIILKKEDNTVVNFNKYLIATRRNYYLLDVNKSFFNSYRIFIFIQHYLKANGSSLFIDKSSNFSKLVSLAAKISGEYALLDNLWINGLFTNYVCIKWYYFFLGVRIPPKVPGLIYLFKPNQNILIEAVNNKVAVINLCNFSKGEEKIQASYNFLLNSSFKGVYFLIKLIIYYISVEKLKKKKRRRLLHVFRLRWRKRLFWRLRKQKKIKVPRKIYKRVGKELQPSLVNWKFTWKYKKRNWRKKKFSVFAYYKYHIFKKLPFRFKLKFYKRKIKLLQKVIGNYYSFRNNLHNKSRISYKRTLKFNKAFNNPKMFKNKKVNNNIGAFIDFFERRIPTILNRGVCHLSIPKAQKYVQLGNAYVNNLKASERYLAKNQSLVQLNLKLKKTFFETVVRKNHYSYSLKNLYNYSARKNKKRFGKNHIRKTLISFFNIAKPNKFLTLSLKGKDNLKSMRFGNYNKYFDYSSHVQVKNIKADIVPKLRKVWPKHIPENYVVNSKNLMFVYLRSPKINNLHLPRILGTKMLKWAVTR